METRHNANNSKKEKKKKKIINNAGKKRVIQKQDNCYCHEVTTNKLIKIHYHIA